MLRGGGLSTIIFNGCEWLTNIDLNLVENRKTVVFIVVRASVMLIEASNGTNKVTANNVINVTEVILMIVFFSNVKQ